MRRELRRHLGFAPLDLDDQHRLDVERIAGVGEVLADRDRRPVHVFHRHRHDARADDRRDAAARVGAGIEAEQHRARAFGGADQLDRRLDDDAELPLRAADQAEPVEAGGVEFRAAEVEDVAVERDQPDAEQVVDRHAVFQAMRAAGVHADVAADRAGELRGRVGRVEEPVRRHGFGNGEIGDARLDPRVAVGEVDLENAVHLGEAEDDRVLLRDRAAGQRSAGAARHDVDAGVAAEPHDRARPRRPSAAGRRRAARDDRRSARRSRTRAARRRRRSGRRPAGSPPDRRGSRRAAPGSSGQASERRSAPWLSLEGGRRAPRRARPCASLSRHDRE